MSQAGKGSTVGIRASLHPSFLCCIGHGQRNCVRTPQENITGPIKINNSTRVLNEMTGLVPCVRDRASNTAASGKQQGWCDGAANSAVERGIAEYTAAIHTEVLYITPRKDALRSYSSVDHRSPQQGQRGNPSLIFFVFSRRNASSTQNPSNTRTKMPPHAYLYRHIRLKIHKRPPHNAAAALTAVAPKAPTAIHRSKREYCCTAVVPQLRQCVSCWLGHVRSTCFCITRTYEYQYLLSVLAGYPAPGTSRCCSERFRIHSLKLTVFLLPFPVTTEYQVLRRTASQEHSSVASCDVM